MEEGIGLNEVKDKEGGVGHPISLNKRKRKDIPSLRSGYFSFTLKIKLLDYLLVRLGSLRSRAHLIYILEAPNCSSILLVSLANLLTFSDMVQKISIHLPCKNLPVLQAN